MVVEVRELIGLCLQLDTMANTGSVGGGQKPGSYGGCYVARLGTTKRLGLHMRRLHWVAKNMGQVGGGKLWARPTRQTGWVCA